MKIKIFMIKGKYERRNCWIYVYADDKMYRIHPRDPGRWDVLRVGEPGPKGSILLPKEKFDRWKAECKKRGTFFILKTE